MKKVIISVFYILLQVSSATTFANKSIEIHSNMKNSVHNEITSNEQSPMETSLKKTAQNKTKNHLI